MSLGLDLWLAALRVMVLGGEYFPSEFLLAADRDRAARGADPRRDRPSEQVDGAAAVLPGLTAREIQILQLVARGQQNKLIASALQLSENTVKIHIHHIIAKLGVHNRTEAASRYLALGTGPAGAITLPVPRGLSL